MTTFNLTPNTALWQSTVNDDLNIQEERTWTVKQIMGGDEAGEVDRGQIIWGLAGHGTNLRLILRAMGFY